MYKIKLIFLVALVAITSSVLVAQNNNTNSPYTRYGYGALADQASAGQRGMGGIGYGLRNPKMINPMNPASFSSVDSMTFMVDMGASVQLSWYKDGMNKAKKVNGNIEYLALQFPLMKNLGMGFGFEPVSYVGYQYGDTVTLPNTGILGTQTYSGTGGLNKAYTAFSYDLFDRFALGVNIAYLFGDIRHDRLGSYNSATNYPADYADTLRSSAFTFDVGFQYVHPIKKDQFIVLGGVYTPKTKINGKVMEGMVVYDPQTGVIQDSYHKVLKDEGFYLPESFAVGITYNKLNKLTLGADFLYQKWADTEFYSKKDSLANRTKINLGGEFIPNAYSRNFFERIRYRAGAYYSDSYIKVRGAGYKEYGASLGFGLPMNDRRSMVNLAVEYTAIRPEVKTLIDEQYFKVTVSYTFNELWFFKRKIQ